MQPGRCTCLQGWKLKDKRGAAFDRVECHSTPCHREKDAVQTVRGFRTSCRQTCLPQILSLLSLCASEGRRNLGAGFFKGSWREDEIPAWCNRPHGSTKYPAVSYVESFTSLDLPTDQAQGLTSLMKESLTCVVGHVERRGRAVLGKLLVEPQGGGDRAGHWCRHQ